MRELSTTADAGPILTYLFSISNPITCISRHSCDAIYLITYR